MGEHYDKEYDLMYVNWGGKVKHSVKFRNCNIILDFNSKDEIVGIEIIDFLDNINEAEKKLREIYKDD